MMSSFTPPTAFRLASRMDVEPHLGPSMPFVVLKAQTHESHPSVGHLVLLVFEAVMEVVCVSLPGYIVARLGHFDADKQKFLANLNVMLFTPCLIFTKLASQLNADKLLELAIIPVIFVIQTLVSYLVSSLISKAFRFNKRASNFVTAMGVFGNSNSLPISLVISLSQTLKGLHWDKIPGDNDDEVAARGILYLLIFQQLGQMVRWSWGYHVLLAPKDKYEEYRQDIIEEGRYHDESDNEDQTETDAAYSEDSYSGDPSPLSGSIVYEPAGRTPVAGHSRASLADSDEEDDKTPRKRGARTAEIVNGHPYEDMDGGEVDGILSFPRIRNSDEPELPDGIKGLGPRVRLYLRRALAQTRSCVSNMAGATFATLPKPLRTMLNSLYRATLRVSTFLWEFMNPPLWAMLIAVLVASIPTLQRLFFEEGSFIKNSVTSAVTSSGGVAVPLILVVLGANLARNTQPHETGEGADPEELEIGTRLLVASLVARMLLPTIIMAPVLALFAKYVPVSILDDPIFVIVCFLLTGAPSALQLAQICQINGVYENVMSKILFQSYVIWILPSTLILVMCALEVVEWAAV